MLQSPQLKVCFGVAEANVAVSQGRIVEVGDCKDAARKTLDAHGAIVTPGFVDIHTHYDGQVSWDDQLAPSIFHGVTTAVTGGRSGPCGSSHVFRAVLWGWVP